MISEQNLDSIAVTGATPALAAELVAELRTARNQQAVLAESVGLTLDGLREELVDSRQEYKLRMRKAEAERDALLAQRQAALDLHPASKVSMMEGQISDACLTCKWPYPCPTRRVLGGKTP